MINEMIMTVALKKPPTFQSPSAALLQSNGS